MGRKLRHDPGIGKLFALVIQTGVVKDITDVRKAYVSNQLRTMPEK